MKNKIIIGVVALLVGIFVGYEVFHASSYSVGAVSPAGTTNSNFKIASINITPSTASATSTSILNTDSFDRGLSGVDVMCTSLGTSNAFLTGNTAGATIAGFVMQIGTTSVANQGLQGNASIYASTTIATSTPLGTTFVATSTEGVVTGQSRIWPSGTYLTIQFNATNTGACTVSSKYLPL